MQGKWRCRCRASGDVDAGQVEMLMQGKLRCRCRAIGNVDAGQVEM